MTKVTVLSIERGKPTLKLDHLPPFEPYAFSAFCSVDTLDTWFWATGGLIQSSIFHSS